MAKRKSVGKAQRFRIFSRDGFTCLYCGRKPPEVVLHIDHITPVVEGGTNEDSNLISACADCNLGKSKHTIEALSLRAKINEQQFKEAQEAREQLEAYQAFLQEEKSRREDDIAAVDDVLASHTGHSLSESGRKTVAGYLDKLPVVQVAEAMEIACGKIEDPGNAFKYFCGICRNKIKYANDPTAEFANRAFYIFDQDYRKDFSHYPSRQELRRWWEAHVWGVSSKNERDAQRIGRAMLDALRSQWPTSNQGGYFRCLADEVEPQKLWVERYNAARSGEGE